LPFGVFSAGKSNNFLICDMFICAPSLGLGLVDSGSRKFGFPAIWDWGNKSNGRKKEFMPVLTFSEGNGKQACIVAASSVFSGFASIFLSFVSQYD
jgi:hypothetical protein